jgi:hypothetical protein
MKQPVLIGVYGKARSGKDTMSDYLAARMHLRKYAFAEPIKQMLTSVFGPHFHTGDREQICPEAGISYRALMQTLGTEWGRAVNPDLWVNLVAKQWNTVKDGFWSPETGHTTGMILSDVRFDSEARWIKEQGGILIEIDRPGIEEVGIAGHASERGISPGLTNVKVHNTGDLAYLHQTLDSLMKDYLTKV